ncbi:COMM domain-containing protein 3 [Cephus cinctus]|uniref:COMM domain-containing protein 3 n=1 Tax=Cephus cinctus TaxID=211228 RepID=A0AAJ7BYI7_CEPCN|nr:COMM domain-containing protein 3 [Cephus cinctus]
MELSKRTIKGLSYLQNVNVISDETFGKLVEITISHVCEKPDAISVSQIYGSKPDIIKAVFADLTILLVEAGRHSYDKEKLSNYLQSVQISGPRIDKICESYSKYRTTIKRCLENIGTSLPHVVDVSWCLDYCIKSNTENSVGMPLYHIRLSTIKQSETIFLKFTCTTQQLQELVYKLKDAVRHVEKIANT